MKTGHSILEQIITIIVKEGEGGILSALDPLELLLLLRSNGALGCNDARQMRTNPNQSNHSQLSLILSALEYGEQFGKIGRFFAEPGMSFDEDGLSIDDKSVFLYVTSLVTSPTLSEDHFDDCDESQYKYVNSRQYSKYVMSHD